MNTLNFVSHPICHSLSAPSLQHEAARDNMETRGHGYSPMKPYL